MHHLIKKQIIDLTLRNKKNSFHLQNLVGEQYRRDILPSLEKLFDEISGEDEIIQLDKLEIDLGIISEKDIERNSWKEKLISNISEQINKKISSSSPEQLIFRGAKSLGICRQWLFYIQNGYLPWNAIQVNETWKSKVLEALAVDFAMVSELRLVIRRNNSATSRIILQHSKDFLRKLIEILTAENQGNLILAIEEVYAVFQWLGKQKQSPHQIITDKNTFQNKLWEHILNLASSGDKDLKTEKLITNVFQPYKRDITESIKLSNKPLPGLNIIAAVIKQITEAQGVFKEHKIKPDYTGSEKTIEALRKQEGDAETQDKKIRKDVDSKAKEEREFDNFKLDEASEDSPTENEIIESLFESADDTSQKSTLKIDEEGIFVQNAGAVLVHSFLKSLFTLLELVHEGKFIHLTAQQKALYMIHYLSTGKTDAEEYELVVPKILCAYPLEMPVEKDIQISNDELNEADEMLKVVIRQWGKLKATSPAGLREGFLQRNGKVFTRNDNLYMKMESSSIDVLLDTLPWNLSMIKLPWMKDILRVEWR